MEETRSLWATLGSVDSLNICGSSDFLSVCNHLSQVGSDSLSVYTDSSFKNLDTIGCWAGAAVFFEDINLGLSISVHGLVLSTLAELQTIILALECIPRSCSVCLFLDSQAALDACKLKLNLMHSDFCNWCWVKHQHINNIICSKNLKVTWCKVKSHFSILGNDCADSLADTSFFSGWFLSSYIGEHFLVANGGTVSGNSRHFVQDVFRAVYHVHWKVGSGSGFLVGGLLLDVNWLSFSQLFENVSIISAISVFYACIELSGHSLPLLSVLQLLSSCALDFLVFSAIFKDFVFNGWFSETVSVFHDSKVARIKVAEFVHSLCLTFRDNIWVVYAKHCVFMEKHRLIPINGLAPISVSVLALKFSAGVIKLLGISEAFGVYFGFHKSCLFFLSISTLVSVDISA
ncbi:hypothetical protein G9A89_006442 [Geosiphon pyriformis]|nr:hypothetical protein G9A89_006442 [Geosiphon pyriformis]